MKNKIYDTIIIGGGPAGLSAALYAGRAKLSVLMIEKGMEGGQIAQTSEVENYPGGVMGESGAEFISRLSSQAFSFGAEKVFGEVTNVELDGDIKTVKTSSEEYKGKTLIVASGNYPNTLRIPGEMDYAGRGVSYCATCDAPFFGGLETYVVGGGDAAVEEAIYLSKFAKKVTIVHRRDQLRASKWIQDKAFATDNIEFLWDSVIKEIKGGDLLESIVVENVKSGQQEEIFANKEDGTMGVFVFIGLKPNTGFLEGKLEQAESGHLKTDENMHTGIDGVFAAGDVRDKKLRQVVTATADGAIAAVEVEKYLEQ